MPPRRVRPATGSRAPPSGTPAGVPEGDEGDTPEEWLSRVVGVGSKAAQHMMAFFERVDVRTLAEVQKHLEDCAEAARAGDLDAMKSLLHVTADFPIELSTYATTRIKLFYAPNIGEPPGGGPGGGWDRCWALNFQRE